MTKRRVIRRRRSPHYAKTEAALKRLRQEGPTVGHLDKAIELHECARSMLKSSRGSDPAPAEVHWVAQRAYELALEDAYVQGER